MVTLQNLTELYPEMLDDNIVLPEGLSKDTLKSVIMMRLGLCWPVYDEPEVFSTMLYSWFMAHQWNIERLIKVTETSYSPLENYDRQEDFTDTGTGAKVGTDNNNNTRDITETVDNDTSGTGSSMTTTGGTSTNSVSAYNSTEYTPDNQNVSNGTNEVHTSSTGSLDETRRTAGYIKDDRSIREETSNSGRHAGRAHGNIGVTTTQEMFNQELELLSGYNMYYTICNWIERDLFIQVY